jgi:hypothetical protein
MCKGGLETDHLFLFLIYQILTFWPDGFEFLVDFIFTFTIHTIHL